LEIRKDKTGLNKSNKLQGSRGLTRLLLLVVLLFSVHLIIIAQEKGKASYYSQRLHGARMSDGSKYHRDSMTCAHRRYPLGTMLKVTNLSNGKSVVVKVTDRGPHARGRIIDLSYAAAKEINMIAAGIATVRVEPYKEHTGIPYRNDDKDDIEIDFEFNKHIFDYEPKWQIKENNGPVFTDQMRDKVLDDEEKISQMKDEIHTPTKTDKNKKREERPVRTPHKASQRHSNQ